MGYGTSTSSQWRKYTQSRFAGRSTQEIYSARSMTAAFCPKNRIRESCDSQSHPCSTPIILGLDVTGSMGRILNLVANKIGGIMTEIYARQPVTDPQILFAAVGDYRCGDRYPLQVTQFESDILIAGQLQEIYFEGGGGGNGFESYPLIWYFAANNTKCDNYLKRKQKGFLFTFGDDGLPKSLLRQEIRDVFGDPAEREIPVDELYAKAAEQWEIFHFCMAEGGSHRERDYRNWQYLLGERAILCRDYTKLGEIIVSILEYHCGKDKHAITQSWAADTADAVADALSGLRFRR